MSHSEVCSDSVRASETVLIPFTFLLVKRATSIGELASCDLGISDMGQPQKAFTGHWLRPFGVTHSNYSNYSFTNTSVG